MSTVTKTRANARLKLAGSVAAASLAFTQEQVPAHVMRGRAEALRLLEQIIADRQASVDQLEAILTHLEGFAGRLMEDCIGCLAMGGNWGSTLLLVVDDLRSPSHQYQPGRAKPVPYQPLLGNMNRDSS